MTATGAGRHLCEAVDDSAFEETGNWPSCTTIMEINPMLGKANVRGLGLGSVAARIAVLGACAMTGVVALGCRVKPEGNSLAEQRSFILGASSELLAMVYEDKPELESDVEAAPGYAVFTYRLSKLPIVLGGLGGGGGYGILVNNRTDEKVYMKVTMGEWGLGLGTRVFGSVFVFENEEVVQDFVTKGWEFGGGADAALKADDKGISANVGVAVAPGMRIYTISKSGMAYAATLRGTKYSADKRLN
jgi:lipid-binding SYLF domain-containing protein